MATLDVRGLREARRALRRLADGGSLERVIRPALRTAAAPFVSAVREGSPRSNVEVRDVRPTVDGKIAVVVDVRDDATPAQRSAVSEAFHGEKSGVRSTGQRLVVRAVEREAES